jgi:hypothetical protein
MCTITYGPQAASDLIEDRGWQLREAFTVITSASLFVPSIVTSFHTTSGVNLDGHRRFAREEGFAGYQASYRTGMAKLRSCSGGVLNWGSRR